MQGRFFVAKRTLYVSYLTLCFIFAFLITSDFCGEGILNRFKFLGELLVAVVTNIQNRERRSILFRLKGLEAWLASTGIEVSDRLFESRCVAVGACHVQHYVGFVQSIEATQTEGACGLNINVFRQRGRELVENRKGLFVLLGFQ